MKKVIQLHADQKISMIIHTDINGNRASQNIRDGHREKHEIQPLVLSEKRQFPGPRVHPALQSLVIQFTPEWSTAFAWRTVSVSYESKKGILPNPVPVYLLSHRFLV